MTDSRDRDTGSEHLSAAWHEDTEENALTLRLPSSPPHSHSQQVDINNGTNSINNSAVEFDELAWEEDLVQVARSVSDCLIVNPGPNTRRDSNDASRNSKRYSSGEQTQPAKYQKTFSKCIGTAPPWKQSSGARVHNDSPCAAAGTGESTAVQEQPTMFDDDAWNEGQTETQPYTDSNHTNMYRSDKAYTDSSSRHSAEQKRSYRDDRHNERSDPNVFVGKDYWAKQRRSDGTQPRREDRYRGEKYSDSNSDNRRSRYDRDYPRAASPIKDTEDTQEEKVGISDKGKTFGRSHSTLTCKRVPSDKDKITPKPSTSGEAVDEAGGVPKSVLEGERMMASLTKSLFPSSPFQSARKASTLDIHIPKKSDKKESGLSQPQSKHPNHRDRDDKRKSDVRRSDSRDSRDSRDAHSSRSGSRYERSQDRAHHDRKESPTKRHESQSERRSRYERHGHSQERKSSHNRERDTERDRAKDRDRYRERESVKERDRDRDRDKDRRSEKERRWDRFREAERERDRHRDPGHREEEKKTRRGYPEKRSAEGKHRSLDQSRRQSALDKNTAEKPHKSERKPEKVDESHSRSTSSKPSDSKEKVVKSRESLTAIDNVTDDVKPQISSDGAIPVKDIKTEFIPPNGQQNVSVAPLHECTKDTQESPMTAMEQKKSDVKKLESRVKQEPSDSEPRKKKAKRDSRDNKHLTSNKGSSGERAHDKTADKNPHNTDSSAKAKQSNVKVKQSSVKQEYIKPSVSTEEDSDNTIELPGMDKYELAEADDNATTDSNLNFSASSSMKKSLPRTVNDNAEDCHSSNTEDSGPPVLTSMNEDSNSLARSSSSISDGPPMLTPAKHNDSHPNISEAAEPKTDAKVRRKSSSDDPSTSKIAKENRASRQVGKRHTQKNTGPGPQSILKKRRRPILHSRNAKEKLRKEEERKDDDNPPDLQEMLKESLKKVDANYLPDRATGCFVQLHDGVQESVVDAVKLGCRTFGFSLHGPNKQHTDILTIKEVTRFGEYMEQCGFDERHAIVKSSWPLDLSRDEDSQERTRSFILTEIFQTEALDLDLYVIRLGKPGETSRNDYLKHVAKFINRCHEYSCDAITVIENAFHGSEIKGKVDELGELIYAIEDKSRIGICFDLDQAWKAGYDLSTTDGCEEMLENLDEFGLKYVKVIQLKDPDIYNASVLNALLNDPRLANVPVLLTSQTAAVERLKQLHACG